jgi:hypothetical protein
MAWQCISPELTVKGFKSAICPTQWTRLMVICCGMAIKRMGMLGVSVTKMKALTLKIETVMQIGKGR